MGMAQGAHNLPKVWGDKTVRPQEKITGLGSGLKAAVKVRIANVIIYAIPCSCFLLFTFIVSFYLTVKSVPY